MAASPSASPATERTPARHRHPVDAALDAWAATHPALPLAVAYSGGADSSALLHACVRRWPDATVAWHVHHGLQVAADDFERHCRTTCARLGIPLVVAHVNARAAPGESPEAAARRSRYAAYDQLAAEATPMGPPATVALAQHADDQVETLLIALLRGAGLPGLAGMPQAWERNGLQYVRPLLHVPRAALRDWLAERALSWVEDPTNADPRYLRNHIRSALLPILETVAPAFRSTCARTAAHMAEAESLLEELARQDLRTAEQPPRIQALQQLSEARLANMLRYWLRGVAGRAPSCAQLRELQRQIHACSTRGHHIRLWVAGGWVVRTQTVLRWTQDA